ncbi:MAG: winged helix-turn-helix transcriptional regulator [Rhodobiaceae bacterium]|nr:winged helix-turn-helix transcriptional regulator [Rhodobiaceae bacterium]MCC0014211.1 winged helix-turn-helix transcriptional regulator [Rhodobiaceae bacterium]MCC0051437.1 winged helix-turn-helix transcriptional regulator [Rhodobiaceae bacterium]MCC0062399.1 winged helix-turn-helix transcriptional regulator [Rhodobiaceae bacterium]
MKEGPDIALLGNLIGDPARANMLLALMSGKALTASELAAEAGITSQTASSHLGKLEGSGLLTQRKQGRHRYYALSGPDVGHLLETMMGLAARQGHLRTRTGPRDEAMRKARVCYNHLAGDMGVMMFDSLLRRGALEGDGEDIHLSASGRDLASQLGIDIAPLTRQRRPLCRSCLDWSARKSHLAGSLGTALLDRFYSLGWASRQKGSRVVIFSPEGERHFLKLFKD